jgi:CAAX protease family protein
VSHEHDYCVDRAVQRRPLLPFFLLSALLSWLPWAPLSVAGLGWTKLRCSPYLHLLGGLGPMAAAIAVTAACDGRPGLRLLVERCITVRGKVGSLAIAAGAPILLFVGSALVLRSLGQGEVAWADAGTSVEYPALGRGAYWASSILCYGFGEEVGWRGFALPRLQARHTALTSAVLLSVPWAVWHVPLFAFSSGLSSMGVGGVLGWFSSLVTGSILLTWLFNRSRGSVLAVALFHGVLDIVMTSPAKGALPSVMGTIITLWGLSLPFLLGRTNLSGRPRVHTTS